MDKYGPPQRTKYKVVVENLSTRVSWQVSPTLFLFRLYIFSFELRSFCKAPDILRQVLRKTKLCIISQNYSSHK